MRRLEPPEVVMSVLVRGLAVDDLERVIGLDAKIVGRRREEFFKLKLQQNLQETGIKVSLAAELDDCFCGFLLARVYYGEFGALEPVAVLDTLGVHPDFRGRGVGSSLLGQSVPSAFPPSRGVPARPAAVPRAGPRAARA
jgi:ribosomal protein S18 acetylase RimI-like enzyme